MNKMLAKCAFIGGIIVFVWGMISWMLLPWHTMAMNKFKDEQRVAEVIRENAPISGVYILPNMYRISGTEEEIQKQMAKDAELMQKGPVMFSSICLTGMDVKSVSPFITSIIINILAAGVITWMLMQTKGLKFMNQVGFITLGGVFVALVGDLPQWNWWGFAGNYIFVCMLDHVVGWFLAGLAMAKLMKKR